MTTETGDEKSGLEQVLMYWNTTLRQSLKNCHFIMVQPVCTLSWSWSYGYWGTDTFGPCKESISDGGGDWQHPNQSRAPSRQL